MNCPIDGVELITAKYEAAIEVDQCPQCDGMWLDCQELEQIQATLEHDHASQIKQLPDLVGNAYAMALARSRPELKCPRCDRTMERREHGGCSQVMIDICPQCRGIWLDKDELVALEVFFERAQADTEEVRTGFFRRLLDLFD